MKERFAYTFKSDLTLGEMLKQPNDAGPWKWHPSDNDRWGEYMVATPLARETQHAYVKPMRAPPCRP